MKKEMDTSITKLLEFKNELYEKNFLMLENLRLNEQLIDDVEYLINNKLMEKYEQESNE